MEAEAARMIAQLRLIQGRAALEHASIVVVGPDATTVLHEQILELLSYALVLSGNRVLTTSSPGADRAVIRGAARADEQMLTVVVPDTVAALPFGGAPFLARGARAVELGHINLPEEIESRLVYAELLSSADRLYAFTTHRSRALLQVIEEAQAMNVETCVLFLD
ncbi:hypothetical protein T492DRAFT_1110322 [Pavlovales sp. CCMP2436]|nr:hypothetical protein T492DRAFT_1110322 [Pavlovales sp. CCMP2436]